MNHVIVDTEIQRTIEETPGGWSATDKLGVSVALVYVMGEDRYEIYGDTSDERERLKYRLITAERITTFNGWRFDLPLIWGFPQPMRVLQLQDRSDDLLRRIWAGLGLDPDGFSKAHDGWGLNAVCQATLGRGKTGHGSDAPKLYQAGRWVELISYCLEDLRLTRDLCRFVDEHGLVLGSYGRRVALTPWEKGA